MTDNEKLLIWAGQKLQRAQADKIFGTVTFHFENGRLSRSETKELDVPLVTKKQQEAPKVRGV